MSPGRLRGALSTGIAVLSLLPVMARAQVASSEAPDAPRRGPPLGLGFSISAATTHQFGADIDTGGSFNVTRLIVRAGTRYAFSEGSFVGLTVGYGFDDYSFSPDAQVAGLAPWGKTRNLTVSAPIFFAIGDRWQALLIPNLRMAAERTEDWGEGLMGGFISGVSYRFSDRFAIGPGIGLATEITGSPTVFPVILIDWKITERLRMETGRGLGATRGPGVVLSYQAARLWQMQVGFRFEQARFRLGPEAASPMGIGEDRSFPVIAGVRFGFPFASVSLIGGAEFGGRLRIEDGRGNLIGESSHAPAPFIGAAAGLLF